MSDKARMLAGLDQEMNSVAERHVQVQPNAFVKCIETLIGEENSFARPRTRGPMSLFNQGVLGSLELRDANGSSPLVLILEVRAPNMGLSLFKKIRVVPKKCTYT